MYGKRADGLSGLPLKRCGSSLKLRADSAPKRSGVAINGDLNLLRIDGHL
jgi:hypothetical protein